MKPAFTALLLALSIAVSAQAVNDANLQLQYTIILSRFNQSDSTATGSCSIDAGAANITSASMSGHGTQQVYSASVSVFE